MLTNKKKKDEELMDQEQLEEQPVEEIEEGGEIPHLEEREDAEAEETTTEPSEEDQAPVDDEEADLQGHDDPDMFPRDYVKRLRKESGDYRGRAKTAEARVEELEQRLHAALVKADGRLADPEDLEFAPEHLEDPEALASAIEDLVKRKPGLRALKYSGDVGAGARGSAKKPTTDLIEILRSM